MKNCGEVNMDSNSSKMNQIERLFFIVTYLTNHEFANAGTLAELCNTSTRTIYRDMRYKEIRGSWFLFRN